MPELRNWKVVVDVTIHSTHRVPVYLKAATEAEARHVAGNLARGWEDDQADVECLGSRTVCDVVVAQEVEGG